MASDGPIRVSIVGGGCAGMAAAWELTRPEHRGRYQVTVHQVGWRLGGKGASGRGPGDRIEEHGLHVWLGFYENAFRLMRECYDELARDPDSCRIAHWSDAFFRDAVVGVMEEAEEGAWDPWLACFPPGDGEPGDPLTRHCPFTVTHYLQRTVELLRTLLFSAIGAQTAPGAPPPADDSAGTKERVGELLANFAALGSLVSAAGLIEALRLLEGLLDTLPDGGQARAAELVDALASGLRDLFERAVVGRPGLRRTWEIADMTLAILRGSLREGLATDPRGFDAINDHDVRDWLRLHGASERSVNNAIVRGLYDLALAYREGDARRPGIAAGQGIRGALRMFFTYRGSLFWKMRSGMGDVVFAPFHEALSARGVKFRFFHRLRELVPSQPGEPAHVAAMDFDVQAETLDGSDYRPLVAVRDLPCWPSQPDWAQLQDGEALRAEGRDFECHWDERCVRSERLEVGRDFDLVVLAVGGGAVPHVARRLIERNERWAAMAANLNTVATQAFQLWMREDVEDLGWPHGPANVSAFAKPFDTWADMSHLGPEESHPCEPRSVAYFCGVLDDPAGGPPEDPAFPERERARVKRNALDFLERRIQGLWPLAHRPAGGFRWDVLVAPDERPGEAPSGSGPERFDTQYWRANVNPSDRYVLALPGTLEHRLSPLDDSYDNLTVAGDWTDSGFNEGCVEAAVMSGRLAAHAISGSPRLEDIVGYDHP